MGKINDLSTLDKPREKAERFGIEKLTDAELLALIINVGTVGHSSLEIAKDLLKDCGSLSDLLGKPHQYFQTFKGLKKVNALKLTSVMEIARRINEKRQLIKEEKMEVNSDALYHRYSLALMGQVQELFNIIILNKNKQIVYETTLYKGNDNNIVISLRDIVRLILLHNGYYYYLIHNHPNDSSEPSQADIDFTMKIKAKTDKIGVKLLDHLIITKNGYYSFLHDKVNKEWN